MNPRLHRRKAKEGTLAQSYAELRLLSALALDGCPICHETSGLDDSYFFWWFNERYMEPFSLDALTRSLGFCSAHAAWLVRAPLGAFQLTAVHRVLARRIHDELRAMAQTDGRLRPEASALAGSGVCPPCQSREESAAHCAFWTPRILEDPVERERYGGPGLLCFRHLQQVIPRVSTAVLERLLAMHETALAREVRALRELRKGVSSIAPEARQDLGKALLSSLRLAVGHERVNLDVPPAEDVRASSPARDPVGEMLDALRQGSACPICLEVRRAWIEWVAWLDGATERGDDVDALLPTCPDHVWAVQRVAGEHLALATAERALAGVSSVVHLAVEALRSSLPRNERRLAPRISDALWGPRRRVQRAREGLSRPLACGVCRRLEVAEDRAIELLFALAEDRRHRRLIEAGYALCLKHLSRCLARDPAPAVASLLLAVEAARLARLEWELEEALRKTCWDFRPEVRGRESSAWSRAVLKFSGSMANTSSRTCSGTRSRSCGDTMAPRRTRTGRRS